MPVDSQEQGMVPGIPAAGQSRFLPGPGPDKGLLGVPPAEVAVAGLVGRPQEKPQELR